MAATQGGRPTSGREGCQTQCVANGSCRNLRATPQTVATNLRSNAKRTRMACRATAAPVHRNTACIASAQPLAARATARDWHAQAKPPASSLFGATSQRRNVATSHRRNVAPSQRRTGEGSEQSDPGTRHSQIQRQSTDTRGESEDSNSPIVALLKVKHSTDGHIGWHRPCLRTAHAFEPSRQPAPPRRWVLTDTSRQLSTTLPKTTATNHAIRAKPSIHPLGPTG
jgi:hypothetical protein